jgi:D-alanyl-D-alanine endopeptidase (penicillin-binding protein 7)
MNRALLALVAMLAITGNAFAQKGDLTLKSRSALIFDAQQGHVIYSKNIDTIMPIASITKLITAMVVLDAQLPLSEEISIDSADIDVLKNTRSRLKVGSSLTRQQLLRLALMSSENRAAAALGRAYPGGILSLIHI